MTEQLRRLLYQTWQQVWFAVLTTACKCRDRVFPGRYTPFCGQTCKRTCTSTHSVSPGSRKNRERTLRTCSMSHTAVRRTLRIKSSLTCSTVTGHADARNLYTLKFCVVGTRAHVPCMTCCRASRARQVPLHAGSKTSTTEFAHVRPRPHARCAPLLCTCLPAIQS